MLIDENQNFQSSDFSGIPALDDVNGLENYLQTENLRAMGIQQPEQPQQQETPAAPQAQAGQPANVDPAAITSAAQPADTMEAMRQQIAALEARIAALTTPNARPAQQPQQAQQGYTPQELTFIQAGLQRGYTLEQLNNTIMQRRAGGINPAVAQRLTALEQQMKQQEYAAAESAFIQKVSTFGEKWGLTEQDLVTFGQEALRKGINIALPEVDLETVFRAVYPKQYAIRSQRMNPNTNTSQIYGGNSIPEGTRQMASKAEDAYVEAFLKQSMPGYGRK